MANHAAVLVDGESMWWPSHTSHLDFELELACVLAHVAPAADDHRACEPGPTSRLVLALSVSQRFRVRRRLVAE
jgi:hypothetical protein